MQQLVDFVQNVVEERKKLQAGILQPNNRAAF
jgi:hypothetical protein